MSKKPTIEEIERRREARRPLVDKISSKLPKYFKSKLNDKHGGGVTQFGSKFYFNPVPYIRYTFSTGEVYMMNQPKVIKEIPINEDGYTSITFYNIMDDVEMHFDWEPGYVSSASYFDIDHMVIFNQDLGEEVVKVDYEEWAGWLRVDLEKYLRIKLSPETVIDDLIQRYKVRVGDAYYKLPNLMEYRDEHDICNEKTYVFKSWDNVRTFIRHIDEDLDEIELGETFSDIYDNILNGSLSKEDFLAKMVK